MEIPESLKSFWRERGLSCLDMAERDAKRVLTEFPEEVDIPEDSPHINQEPWRHHPKEVIIKYFYESFIKHFENVETDERLDPHEFQLYLQLKKLRTALRILELIDEVRTYLDPIERPLFSDFLDMRFHHGFRLGYEWGSVRGGDVITHPSTMEAWRSLVISNRVKKTRWADHNEPFERAITLADNLYRNGNISWHHEMVYFLMNEIEEFKSIQDGDEFENTKRKLLKEIGKLVKERYPERFYNPGEVKKGKQR
jgi:hypothetical protein